MQHNPSLRIAIILTGRSLEGGGGAERRFFRLWAYVNEKRPGACELIVNDSLYRSAVAAKICDRNSEAPVTIVPDGNPLSLSWRLYRTVKQRRIRVAHIVLAQIRVMPFYLMLGLDRSVIVTHTVTASHFAHPVKVPLHRLVASRYLWLLARRIDSLYEGFVDQYARRRRLARKVSISPCSFTDVTQYTSTLEKEPLIVFAGRLDHEKNPLLFVEAIRQLRTRTNGDWHALIAGDGPMREQVVEAVRNAKLDGLIEINRFADMSPVFARSAVFVSTQRTENYPSQSLIEAMVARNAIIATDVGETRRLVRDGDTGLLTTPDARQLADKLELLINDSALREALGTRARHLVLAQHTLARFAGYIEAMWQQVVA